MLSSVVLIMRAVAFWEEERVWAGVAWGGFSRNLLDIRGWVRFGSENNEPRADPVKAQQALVGLNGGGGEP